MSHKVSQFTVLSFSSRVKNHRNRYEVVWIHKKWQLTRKKYIFRGWYSHCFADILHSLTYCKKIIPSKHMVYQKEWWISYFIIKKNELHSSIQRKQEPPAEYLLSARPSNLLWGTAGGLSFIHRKCNLKFMRVNMDVYTWCSLEAVYLVCRKKRLTFSEKGKSRK